MRSIVAITTPATDLNLTTLANVKSELKITDGSLDEQLSKWIAQASAIAARYCNRTLAKETVTETFRRSGRDVGGFDHPSLVGGYWRGRLGDHHQADGLTLTRYPIISIASVTVDGNLVDASQYEFDETRVYRLTSNGYPQHWHFGKSVVVAYDAGYAIPITAQYADLERAVIAIIRMFWSVTLREDPNLKSRTTEGVSSLEWWVPTASATVLPVEISGLLDQFARKWGWMS